jgi:caa(3)-type oxidase subunit IV
MSDMVEVKNTTHDEHAHSDTVRVPFIGEITVVGGIYTVIFGVLGILTLIEVIVAELLKEFHDGPVYIVRTIILFTISLIKAGLVVWFYMHLKQDNPIFRLILIVPAIIVTISIIYLLGVPLGAGGGYR